VTTHAALLIADVVVGGVLVAASMGRWRTSSGALLVAGGGAWWLADLAPAMTFLHRGFLIHLVLSHPGGRLGTPVRVAVTAGYLYSALFSVAANDAASLGMATVVVVVAGHRTVVTNGQHRRSTRFALGAAACLGAALVVGPVSRISGVGTAAGVLALYDVMVVCVALTVLADVLRVRSSRVALTGLVVDLGEATDSDVLRGRLAARLGDPALAVGYWVPTLGCYADDSGRPIDLPAPGHGRTVTPLELDGKPVAVLIHDSAVVRDPRLLAEVAAAAQWAMGNVALRAQVREQVERVEASRRRIVTAADDERARLEERLQQGAGRRLARAAELITAEGSHLRGLADDLARARAQVDTLARGLHPRTLTENGLREALGELAAGSPVPVHLAVAPLRFPAATETTLYFACAEALANVLKYARATRVDVRMTRGRRSVAIVVADDGVGGADPRRGTGLRGLADRVEALGGHLAVDSPVGRGTRVEFTLPLALAQAPSTTESP
jgi:signal transduction histidine kinase